MRIKSKPLREAFKRNIVQSIVKAHVGVLGFLEDLVFSVAEGNRN